MGPVQDETMDSDAASACPGLPLVSDTSACPASQSGPQNNRSCSPEWLDPNAQRRRAAWVEDVEDEDDVITQQEVVGQEFADKVYDEGEDNEADLQAWLEELENEWNAELDSVGT
jgi:hypothetical protein